MDINRIPKRLYQWTPTHGKRRSGRPSRAVATAASHSRVGKIRTFPQSFLIFLYVLLFFLNLSLFSSSFWFSGWAARPPGKALATLLRPRTTWKNVIQWDLRRLGTEWSTEEAEVAAQDRSVWRYLSSQAACAELHEADW